MPATKLTDKSFEALAKSLRCWLDFQIHCGREQLLSESFLTQPIGEFLMAHYSGYLKPEENHPQLKQAKKGRPRQLDYVLLSHDHQALEFGVECKWTGSTKPTRQSIVDDVMRLECLRRPVGQNGTCARFFVFAGRKKTVTSFLEGVMYKTGEPQPPRFLDGFLPVAVSSTLQRIAVKTCKTYYRDYFVDFSNGYKLDLPNSYRTRLVADETGDDVRVLIWKIGSMGKRTTFKHGVTW
jgi:hypothetical protein